MKSTAKRILSLLLCAVMWFSCLGTAGVTALEDEHDHDHDSEANASSVNEAVTDAAEDGEVSITLTRDPADGSFDENQYCLAPTVSVAAAEGHVIDSVEMNGETVEPENYASFKPKGIEGSVKVTVKYDTEKTRELSFSFGHERSGRKDIRYENGTCAVTYQYFYCKRCGSYWGEYRTGGKHNYGETKKVNSCDGRTYELTECEDCGYVYRIAVTDENTEPEKAHTWTTAATSQAPDCGGFSVTVEVCSECGDVNVTVAIGEHIYKDKGEVKAPTCTEQGTRTVTCSKCGKEETLYVPALGHQFDKGRVTKEADCQNEGVKTYTCGRCGETKTEVIPKGGHKYTPSGDCTVATTCDLCGEVVIEASDGHNMAYMPNGLEGHIYYCRNAGCTVNNKTEPHKFTNSVDPTTGTTLRVCELCGFKTSDHEHDFGNWEYLNESTHKRTCGTCGAVETAPHKAEADDGDCTTARNCTECKGVAVAAKDAHEFTELVFQRVDGKEPRTDAGHMLKCKNCTKYSEYLPHDPEEDDGDCTTPVKCKACSWEVVKAKVHEANGGTVKFDEEGHWILCSNKGCTKIASEKHEHIVNPKLGAKNCKEAEVCTVCGYELRAARVHDLKVTKDNEDGTHHIECKLCDYEDDVEHSFVGDGDCTTADKCVCGAESKPSASHSFGGWEYTDGTTHTRRCENPGCEKTESENHHGTYTDGDCTKPFECAGCGCSLSDGHADHAWEEKPTADGDGHVYKCTNKGCTVTKSEKHVEKAGAYCTDDVVCAICGATVREGMTDHSYVYSTDTGDTDITKKHEVTCSNPGCRYKDWKDHESDHANEKDCKKDSVCKDCGYVIVKGAEKHESWSAVVTENGHYKVCTKCGYQTPEEDHKAPSYYDCTKEKRCVECGYVMDDARNTEHKFVFNDDENGTTHTVTCSDCDYEKTEEHTYDPDRKCDEVLVCTGCGYVKDEAGEHTWGEAVDNEDGTHVYTCEVCGEERPEAHKGGKATCSEKAKCEVCGASYGDVDKTNHTGVADEWTSDGENHWKECGDCGEKVELAAHTFVDGECTVCGAVDGNYNPPVTTDPSDTTTAADTTAPSDTTTEPSDTTKPADTTGEDKPPKTGDSGNSAFLILLAVSVIGVGAVLTVTASTRGKENR